MFNYIGIEALRHSKSWPLCALFCPYDTSNRNINPSRYFGCHGCVTKSRFRENVTFRGTRLEISQQDATIREKKVDKSRRIDVAITNSDTQKPDTSPNHARLAAQVEQRQQPDDKTGHTSRCAAHANKKDG